MSYILVVDDDGPFCELLEIVLRGEGYQVRSARTASCAIDVTRHSQPSLILFDMGLGADTGESFVEAYRALPNASARLVVVSGIANIAVEAARIGAHGFIRKPFELEHVLAIAAQALTDVGELA